jgi:transformation/transcription domain-associated protein
VAIAKKGWLSSNEGVLSSLVSVWRSILAKSRANSPDTQLVDYITIPNLMLDCYMISLEEKQHVALLFHLVEAFEIKSPIEKSRVAFFLYQHAALQTSVPYRRELLEHFFTLYETEGVSWQFKNNGMRLVVNPILRIYFSKPNDLSLFDHPLKTSPGQPNDHKESSSSMIERITKSVWKPLGATGLVKHRDDTMLVELFGLTYLLVVHAQDRVVEARKEIFRFLWTGINLQEPTVKLTAYVACSRFMGSFATPFKFVKLIWTGILRLKDIENRPMYREAIDILAEVVSGKRVPKESNNEKTTPGPIIPEWASRVRAVLNEEGNGTGQLVNLCELLVHNADLFYPYREMFVPVITGSLHRLAFFAGATAELKRLSVDIVEMIFRWERRRIAAKEEADKVDDEASPAKRQRTSRSGLGTAVAAGTVVSSSSGGGWIAPVSIKESITAHLLRLVSTSQEPVSKGGLTADALKLFKEIIGPKGLIVHIKLNFFNRTMKGVSHPLLTCIVADI